MRLELLMIAAVIGFIAGAAIADVKGRHVPLWGGLGYLLFPALGTTVVAAARWV